MNTYGMFPGAPQATGRPWDAMAGFDASVAESAQREVQRYALEQMLLESQKMRQENDRYQQMTPHTVEEANLKNQTTQAQLPGVRADSDIKGMNRDLQRATQPGVIANTNAAATTKYLETGIRNLELTQAHGSPMMTEAAYQEFLRGFPDQNMAKRMPRNYSPEVLPGLTQILRDSPEHNRKIHEIDQKGEWDVKVANINANAQTQRQNLITQARVRGLDESLRRATNPGQRISIAAQILSDPELKEIHGRALAALKVDGPQIAAQYGVKMPPMLPGLPAPMALEWIDQLNKAIAEAQAGTADSPLLPKQPLRIGGKTPEGYNVIGQNPDGSWRIRDPQSGRTGTYRP